MTSSAAGNFTYTYTGVTVNPTNGYASCQFDKKIEPDGGTVAENFGLSKRNDPDGCPLEGECQYPGDGTQIVRLRFSDNFFPAELCLDDCRVPKIDQTLVMDFGSGAVFYQGTYEYADQNCSGSEGDTPEGDVCGVVNGLSVCDSPGPEFEVEAAPKDLDDVPPQGCFPDIDGTIICAAGAATPPTPDNGIPGIPATPDLVIGENTDGSADGSIDNQYNYYSSNTVNDSTGDTPGYDGSSGGTTPGGGDCDPSTDPDCYASGSVVGGTTCDAPPKITGDPLMAAAILQQWRTRCIELPSTNAILDALGFTDAEINGEGVVQTDASATDLAQTFFGMVNGPAWLGGQQCIEDLTLELAGTFVGQDLTVPLSQWCSIFELAGKLLIVASYLMGMRIVIRGF